jgi:hypothetical protein
MRVTRIALVLMCVTLGCRSVQPSELVGTWVMTDSSRREVPTDLRKARARVVLHTDGTFLVSEMPGLFYVPHIRPARLETGNGTWELVSREGKQQVDLNFEVIEGWTDRLPYGTELEVSSGILYYFFDGDSDNGRRVAFEKR